MPPRWLCVLIVASWLLLTGWLFYEELLPRLLPGQAPPVTIDLVEEAQLRRTSLNWTAERNGQPAFTLKTRIEHPRRDAFDLVAEFPAKESGLKREGVFTNGLRVSRLTSDYRVNAAGDLLGFEVRFTATSDEPDDLAYRAVTQALGSLAPNTVVVDVDKARGVLVAHQLHPTPDAAATAAPLP